MALVVGKLCKTRSGRRLLPWWIVLTLFLLAIEYVHAEESNVLILNSAAEPPLSTNSLDGFIDLLVKEALSRINLQLHTVRLPAERALRDSNSGQIDGEIIRVSGLEQSYTNLIPVPEKLMDLEFVAFSQKAIDLKSGWHGLAGYSIGFINGWKILENNVPKEAEITKVQTQSQLFTLLSRDRVDIVIYEHWGGIHLIKAFDLVQAKAIQPPLAVSSMHIYLNKKHRPLVAKLNQALKDMKSDGTYQKIYNQTLRQYQN